MKNTTLFDTVLPILSRTSKNPEPLARSIDSNFKTKGNLLEADILKTATITGDDQTAELFSIIGALASRSKTEGFKFGKVHTEDEIKSFLVGSYLNVSVEAIMVLSLDSSGRVLGADYLGDGTVNFSTIIPRMILEKLSAKGADTVILAHNHPGGLAEPSENDVTSSLALERSLNSCGITLKAHYIVVGEQCEKIVF